MQLRTWRHHNFFSFIARSVRDRWVNIRNTFNYNLRKVDRSKENAKSADDIYIPSWPLWKPLQFLRVALKEEDTHLEVFKFYSDEFIAIRSGIY